MGNCCGRAHAEDIGERHDVVLFAVNDDHCVSMNRIELETG